MGDSTEDMYVSSTEAIIIYVSSTEQFEGAIQLRLRQWRLKLYACQFMTLKILARNNDRHCLSLTQNNYI